MSSRRRAYSVCMAFTIRRVSYFNAQVEDAPGQAYTFLTRLVELGTNLLAFTAFPVGPSRTQLSLFPEDDQKLEHEAKWSGLALDGPHPALLVQGDDQLGALAKVHGKLADAQINIYASNAVADGKGDFGYVIYVRPEEFERAASAMGI